MSKEREVVEKLLSFAFAMSENMIGLTKGNYDENTFIKKTYEYLQKYTIDRNEQKTIKQSLERLEAIDNATSSEALECLECLYSDPDDYRSNDRAKDYEYVKQALQRLDRYEQILGNGRLTDRNYKNTTLDLDSCKPYLRLGQLEDIYEECKKNE